MNANDPAVAVVVPVRNEAGNIAALVEEIAKALDGQWRFEVVYVNDGSSDGTEAELKRLMAQYSWLRRVRHKQSCGQSAAVRSGVTAARAPLIVTLGSRSIGLTSLAASAVCSVTTIEPRPSP